MKQYSVLLLVAGGMTLSSTFAAYAMMDAPSSREILVDKPINAERIQTTNSVTPSEKLKLRCSENASHTGSARCIEREKKQEKIQERRKLQQEKEQKKKDLWQMRDAIIDKLLGGESLSDAEKAEAKVMLAERKERKSEVKSRVEAVKASGEKVWPEKRGEIRKEVRKEEKKEREIEREEEDAMESK